MSPTPENNRTTERSQSRILVVDDEPTLRLGFAYALTNPRMLATTASNGAEALEMLARGKFDAIVLDLRMPEVDGLSVIETMRKRGDDTPVVLCSAYITVHSAVTAIHHRVVDFLMKPVKPAELRAAVQAVTEAGSGPLDRALALARAGRLEQAVSSLAASHPAGGTRDASWLRMLTAMRDYPGELERIEFELSESVLGQLAHRSDDLP
ncbi:response regulator [Haloferula sargassicola]|uniref:Regulator of RpoS n=1 Tax=Haloferula sargassicola TaxID=490096 RepID=A0ABP9UKX7_9BACT